MMTMPCVLAAAAAAGEGVSSGPGSFNGPVVDASRVGVTEGGRSDINTAGTRVVEADEVGGS